MLNRRAKRDWPEGRTPWLDPIGGSEFPENWTIFYWTWWVAYAPMVGLFVGRISRSYHPAINRWRDLLGSLGCWAFLSICGAYAIHLDINELLPISALLTDKGIPQTVVAIIQYMPLGKTMMVIFVMLGFIFLATTLDSAA